jgi:hypothetical protein
MKIAGPLVLALVLGGCAFPYAGRNLPQGTSMAEVESTMGRPKETVVDSGGYAVWFYPSAPNGRTTWAAKFMPDGRLLNVEQRLSKDNFARIQPGATTDKQVHELLGPPYMAYRLQFMPLVEWDYRVLADNRFFDYLVRFSDDGVVREAYLLHDPVYDVGAKGN